MDIAISDRRILAPDPLALFAAFSALQSVGKTPD
jgi:hypothetical protein